MRPKKSNTTPAARRQAIAVGYNLLTVGGGNALTGVALAAAAMVALWALPEMIGGTR
jgi:hypothetical protein